MVRRGPRVHFSFRSPYTWMAITKLRRSIPDLDTRIEFIPYWDPDERTAAGLREAGAEFHYAPMTKAKHLYILHDTKRQAAALGLSMAWPIDDDPWWELPHLGWLLARRLGKAREFYDAVTAARWVHGADVCDENVIRAIGERVGIDGELLVSAPHDDDIRAESVASLVRAYEDDIFGVPYFRVGRHRFWGLDRVDAFAEALRDSLPDLGEPAGVPVGAYDMDTAGGCG